MRTVHESICRDLDAACEREWIETNGIGGFASSTIIGLNARRYHGLLIAATKPPVGRMVLLSKLEETLVIDGRRYDLSSNRYPGAIHPQGHLYMKQFRRDPFPVFVYGVDGIELEKSVWMIQGKNTTVIQYRIAGRTAACSLELRPLIAFRDYHSTTHENGALNPAILIDENVVSCRPYDDLPRLYLAHSGGRVERSGDWYRDFEYTAEQRRGLDFREDLFNPLVLTFDLGGDRTASVLATTEARNAADFDRLRAAEVARRASLVAAAPCDDDSVRVLYEAANQFVVGRGEGNTIIAGYHWFSDWGRDTMIALPGLTLTTGRFDAARKILESFARSVDRGMLPNRFPDAGEAPEYNTVDATLWFFEAVRAYSAYTGDYDFVRDSLFDALADIVSWHTRGTRYGIRVDEDGLLLAGEPGVQLTWMDAKIGDWVVTPRHGKPIEIQALWYNALRTMDELSIRFDRPDRAARYAEIAEKARASFETEFWNAETGCLYDCVNTGFRDPSIRPNQILAVSLPYTMLSPDRAKSIVACVESRLLTPFGLRSLAPSDTNYRDRYEGDPFSRDSAYHQGTVWPWLLGPFVTAYIKAYGRSPKVVEQAKAMLRPILDYMEGPGLGQIPEVFDGDPPHRPAGCIAQAWSVAEILRALVEDVYAAGPRVHRSTSAAGCS